MIGSSTPSRCARLAEHGRGREALDDLPDLRDAPRSRRRPRAISSPARRLRPVGCQQVTIRSPIPASPKNVSGSRAGRLAEPRHLGEPARDQRRLRVVAGSDARRTPPAASAITFFAAAQSSTPTRSSFRYTRKSGRVDRLLEALREPCVLARDHGRAGKPRRDLLGHVRPRHHGDRAARGRASRAARRSPGSRPFVRLSTRRGAGERLRPPTGTRGSGARRRRGPRPRRAPPRSSSRRRPTRSTSVRYRGLRPVSRIAAASSAWWVARVTSSPRSASSREKPVPHDPPPTTTARFTSGGGSRSRPARPRAVPLAELVLDPVAVVARDEARVVHGEAEARRPRRDLGAVEQVEPLAAARGRLARLLQLAEEPVQLAGRDPAGVLVEELGDLVEHARDPAAGLRRGGDERRPLAEAALELGPDVLDRHLSKGPISRGRRASSTALSAPRRRRRGRPRRCPRSRRSSTSATSARSAASSARSSE